MNRKFFNSIDDGRSWVISKDGNKYLFKDIDQRISTEDVSKVYISVNLDEVDYITLTDYLINVIKPKVDIMFYKVSMYTPCRRYCFNIPELHVVLNGDAYLPTLCINEESTNLECSKLIIEDKRDDDSKISIDCSGDLFVEDLDLGSDEDLNNVNIKLEAGFWTSLNLDNMKKYKFLVNMLQIQYQYEADLLMKGVASFRFLVAYMSPLGAIKHHCDDTSSRQSCVEFMTDFTEETSKVKTFERISGFFRDLGYGNDLNQQFFTRERFVEVAFQRNEANLYNTFKIDSAEELEGYIDFYDLGL